MHRFAVYADTIFFAVVAPTVIAVSIDFVKQSRRWRASQRQADLWHALKAAGTP